MAPIYMKISGIDGEVSLKAHEKWIEVLSFSWSAENVPLRSGGVGDGTPSATDFTIIHRIDAASPKLLTAMVSGQPSGDGTATLAIQRTLRDGNKFDYYTLKMSGVLVSTVKQTAGLSANDLDNGGPPVEEVTLNFTKLEESYFASPSAKAVIGVIDLTAPA